MKTKQKEPNFFEITDSLVSFLRKEAKDKKDISKTKFQGEKSPNNHTQEIEGNK